MTMNIKMSTMSTVVIYARVSDDKQGRSASVLEQIDALVTLAERQGLTIVDVVTDSDLSASRYARKDRPGWTRVLRMIAADEVQLVGVWEQSRLTRDLQTFAAFRDLARRHHVRLLTPSGIVDLDEDGLGTGVRALVDEQSSKDTSKRIRRAIASRAVSGQVHGRHAFGYRRVYGSNRELISIEVVEEEAALVRRLAHAIMTGVPLSVLVADLRKSATPTPGQAIAARTGRETASGTWFTKTVKDLVTNPRYAGLRSHHGVLTQATWPALWTPEYRLGLLALLQDPRRDVRKVRGGGLVHELSGVLMCGKCSSPMRYVNGLKKGGPLYCCSGCRGVAIKACTVEETVRNLTLRVLADPRVRPRGESPRLAQAKAERAALLTQLTEVEAAVIARQMTPAMGGRIESALNADLTALTAEVEHLSTPVLEVPDAATLGLRWDTLSAAQRRHAIRTVLGQITVTPAGGRNNLPVMQRLTFPDLAEELFAA